MSNNEDYRTIVIYSANQEFEPHPLMFYEDLNPNDVNTLIRETIDNLKSHINKPNLRVWDPTQGAEINYKTQPVHQYNSLYLAEVQPLIQSHTDIHLSGDFNTPLKKAGGGAGVQVYKSGYNDQTSIAAKVENTIDAVIPKRGEGPAVAEKVIQDPYLANSSMNKSKNWCSLCCQDVPQPSVVQVLMG